MDFLRANRNTVIIKNEFFNKKIEMIDRILKIIFLFIAAAALVLFHQSKENGRYEFQSKGSEIVVFDTQTGDVYIMGAGGNVDLEPVKIPKLITIK